MKTFLTNMVDDIKYFINSKFKNLKLSFANFMMKFGIHTKTGNMLIEMRRYDKVDLPNGDIIIRNIPKDLLDFNVKDGYRIGMMEFNDSDNKNKKTRFILSCKDGEWHEIVYVKDKIVKFVSNLDECITLLSTDEVERFEKLLVYLNLMLLK